MRISDWSSDVCSSDLHGNPRPGARTIEEILREPGILAALGLCRKDRLRSPVADRVSGDGRTRWAEIINLQGRRSARSDGERPWRRPSPDRAGRTRSEEHTSELQSLMRISYAVFCLKKKKQYNIRP